MHFRADGTLIEEFSGDGFANANGSGQRHFTFKGQKLALCMNFTSGWADPRLSLIDYTAGVGSGKQKNIISGTQPQLSSHSQSSINITGCDYEIKTADKHLVLYGLDCDGGIVRVEYKETSAPGIVQNFTATARWDGAGQKVDLTWAKDGNATSYKVFKNSDDLESATEVWSGTDTNCTLDLTLGTGLAHKYRMKAAKAHKAHTQAPSMPASAPSNWKAPSTPTIRRRPSSHGMPPPTVHSKASR